MHAGMRYDGDADGLWQRHDRYCGREHMSGNGIDIGAVYQLLTHVAETVDSHDRKLNELAAGQAALRRAMEDQAAGQAALRRAMDDQAAGQAALRRTMDDQAAALASLRRAVTEYHSSVLGHGILISELDARVGRIEQHLSLPPRA